MYKFSERNNIYVKGGDFTPYYNPLAFQNKRVRGVDAGLAYGFFTFDFVYGQLYRGVEGTFATSEINTFTQDPANPGVPVDTTIIDTIQGLGKYEENIMAFRPGFRLEWLASMAVDMRRHEDLPGVHTRWEHRLLWEKDSR